MIWGLVATTVIIILPLWESRRDLAMVAEVDTLLFYLCVVFQLYVSVH